MNKSIFNFIFMLCSNFVLVDITTAQTKPLACQDDAAAGLKWENERWTIKKFIEQKFILVQEGNNFKKDSVAKVLGGHPDEIYCKKVSYGPIISCMNETGNSIYYSFGTLKGGISTLLGSSMADGGYKDTVSVQAFSCTPF